MRVRARRHGAESADRVHKSFFYGSKHIDFLVPKVNPNPPLELTMAKQAEWALQSQRSQQGSVDMYKSTYKAAY